MYRWIKGSDSFNFVWDNIKTYAEHQSSPNLVKTKYVIIPTINDIKDEVTKFLDKVKENGVFKLMICDYSAYDEEIPLLSEIDQIEPHIWLKNEFHSDIFDEDLQMYVISL